MKAPFMQRIYTSVLLCFCSQTHSEAVRLDDYDELANHKGQESDMFQWLTHQALHGLTGAQVGSVVLKSTFKIMRLFVNLFTLSCN